MPIRLQCCPVDGDSLTFKLYQSVPQVDTMMSLTRFSMFAPYSLFLYKQLQLIHFPRTGHFLHHKYYNFYKYQESLSSALPSAFLVLSCCLEKSGPVRYLFCLGSRFLSRLTMDSPKTCALKPMALLRTSSLSI